MNQELITYIVLGSPERLKGLKLPPSSNDEEYLLANLDILAHYTKKKSFEETIDNLVFSSKGNLIVFLPPSAFPNSESKKILKKISMIDQSSWGWFQYDERKNDFIQNLKKISSFMRSIPNIEQGIYFSKRLYFSVGGIGKWGTSPFKEISKRFYSRIDPQNPLPALIIRTKNLNLFLK
ncbi:MAG: hypothetical protein CMD40_04640 [Gammaproteobacteria bacterium]|nr:hypothetical protein [Gammaproteobacteria bacterium]